MPKSKFTVPLPTLIWKPGKDRPGGENDISVCIRSDHGWHLVFLIDRAHLAVG